MVVDERPTELPCGFEAAVLGLDDMCRRDRFGPCCVYVCGDGSPTIRRYNSDGTSTTLNMFAGEWHAMLEVDDGR